MILETTFVTADLFFQVGKCCFEGTMNITVHAFSVNNGAGVQMGCAIRAKTGTLVRKHYTRLRAALEVLRDYNFQSGAYQLRQRFADFQLFA